eukprot:292323_1
MTIACSKDTKHEIQHIKMRSNTRFDGDNKDKEAELVHENFEHVSLMEMTEINNDDNKTMQSLQTAMNFAEKTNSVRKTNKIETLSVSVSERDTQIINRQKLSIFPNRKSKTIEYHAIQLKQNDTHEDEPKWMNKQNKIE